VRKAYRGGAFWLMLFIDKFKIETLPITDEFLREKRLIQDRDELVLVSDGEEIRYITFFTLNPGHGYFRWGHYHKKKAEKFYIVSGKVRLSLADVKSRGTCPFGKRA